MTKKYLISGDFEEEKNTLLDNFSRFTESVNPLELGDDPLGLELYNDLCRLKEIYKKKDKINSLQSRIDDLNQGIYDLSRIMDFNYKED